MKISVVQLVSVLQNCMLIKEVVVVGRLNTNMVGKKFDTLNFGQLEVIEYINAKNVTVKFIKTGFVTKAEAAQIRKGQVRDRTLPTVFGVGFYGQNKIVDGSVDASLYKIWFQMLRRCYDMKVREYSDRNSTYSGCIVSDNFLHFENFKLWAKEQKGFLQDGFALDKDILVRGNTIYSEETCCFVPLAINNLLIKSNKARGDYPIGVSYNNSKRKFEAYVSKYSSRDYLGQFDTEIEAFLAYKEAKEDYIKEVANKWKDQIDLRVYNALINYKVEITD